jgi:hypothetical protein
MRLLRVNLNIFKLFIESSSTINPTNNVNELNLSTYSVNVKDNSELNVLNLMKENSNNITKIFESNSSKDKATRTDINKKITISGDSNHLLKNVKKGKKILNNKSNTKTIAVSSDSKKIEETEYKNQEESQSNSNSSMDYLSEPIHKFAHSNKGKNILKKQNCDKNSKKELKEISLNKKSQYQPDLLKPKNHSEKSKDSEREDRPRKPIPANFKKLNANSENIERLEENKISKATSNDDANPKPLIEKINYNTINIQKKISKNKNSSNPNSLQSNEKQIKILTIEEKLMLMEKLVRNKEEELIKQVQREVVEKSIKKNEKIQKKLRYLNDRNMLENINIEEVESINEEEKKTEYDENRMQKLNYFENSSSMVKQKRSRSSPHVTTSKKQIMKPRVNTKEYLRQINNERKLYFDDNQDDNNSNINSGIENNIADNKYSNEGSNSNADQLMVQENIENNHLNKPTNLNDNNSFRRLISGDKSKSVVRSASASATINSNENFIFSNNNLNDYYAYAVQSKFNKLTQKRSSDEIKEFIKRKRKDTQDKAIKLKNEKDEKNVKKLVQLARIFETQERVFRKGNSSHSQNPNSVHSTNSKNSDFDRNQESQLKRNHTTNKVKNEMYVGKKKKNPNDSSFVDPDNYYLMVLESKNILEQNETEKSQTNRSRFIEDYSKREDEQSIRNDSLQKDLTEDVEVYKSQIDSDNPSGMQFRMKSYSQSEKSFKDNSRQILQQSLQKSQKEQNSFKYDNSSPFKSFEVKNINKEHSSKGNEESSRIMRNKNQIESITSSNEIISFKSGSYQQCETANFINEKLNEMKAKVSEYKQRAINLRGAERESDLVASNRNSDNINMDDYSKSLTSRRSGDNYNELNNKQEDSMIEEIPRSRDKIQSFIEPIIDDKELRLSDNALDLYEYDGINQLKSQFYQEDVYNQMESASYSNLVPLKSSNKRERLDSDVDMNYKSCDMNVIIKSINNENPIPLKIQTDADEQSNLQISKTESIKKQAIENKIDLDILKKLKSIIHKVFIKSIFFQFSRYLKNSRRLDELSDAFNFLDEMYDGFIAKNVYISFHTICQYPILKNYYEVFNIFTIAAKRDVFKKIKEFSEVVKMYEEEEMKVYENCFNSICIFAKRSAFNSIKEFAYDMEINEGDQDMDKLIEVYTISFNRLFLPWKRNLFYEIINRMYAMMITPRSIEKEINVAPEEANITVQINKEQSLENSQLWYNRSIDEDDKTRKGSDIKKDKPISQKSKTSLTDDIVIESARSNRNISGNLRESKDSQNKSSCSSNKMKLFDKNAAMSRENLAEKSSERSKIMKNNTFVHESFSEKSFLIEFNSYDSPKLHRIHMLIEQQKRAQQNASQDEMNFSKNMSSNDISVKLNGIPRKSDSHRDGSQENININNNSDIQIDSKSNRQQNSYKFDSEKKIAINKSSLSNDPLNISKKSLERDISINEDDISIDNNKQGYSDVDWINNLSVSKSGSFRDVNFSNSIRNSINMVSNVNKSQDESRINCTQSLDKNVLKEIKNLNPCDEKSQSQSKENVDSNIYKNQNQEQNDDIIEEEYEKFDDNIEIEIEGIENDNTDLFKIINDEEDKKSKYLYSKIEEKSKIIEASNRLDSVKLIDDNSDFENQNRSSNFDNKSKNYGASISNSETEHIYQNINVSPKQLSNKDKDNDSLLLEPNIFICRSQNIKFIDVEEKIILDENNINDKMTIETVQEESARKITNQGFLAFNNKSNIEQTNIITIESNENEDQREIFKLKETTEIKSQNLLDDKSSNDNQSSIVPLSDSDFRSIDNKENTIKETISQQQTLTVNKRYDDLPDDISSVKKSEISSDAIDCKENFLKSNEFFKKLNTFDFTELADHITEEILMNILLTEIKDESRALVPKKLFLRQKENASIVNKDESSIINQNNITNDSLSAYSNSANNQNYLNTSMFNKTIIEHKKETSINLYQEEIAPRLINLMTDSVETNYSSILTNLSVPYTNKPNDLLQAITYRDYKLLKQSHKILSDSLKDSAFINKKEILKNFEKLNKQIREENNITSDDYYDNILNECMVDAGNEILKKERKYGEVGEPLPWSTRTRAVRYKYNESKSSVEKLKKLLSDKLNLAIFLKMGLISENNENMDTELLNGERERRLITNIVKEVRMHIF